MNKENGKNGKNGKKHSASSFNIEVRKNNDMENKAEEELLNQDEGDNFEEFSSKEITSDNSPLNKEEEFEENDNIDSVVLEKNSEKITISETLDSIDLMYYIRENKVDELSHKIEDIILQDTSDYNLKLENYLNKFSAKLNKLNNLFMEINSDMEEIAKQSDLSSRKRNYIVEGFTDVELALEEGNINDIENNMLLYSSSLVDEDKQSMIKNVLSKINSNYSPAELGLDDIDDIDNVVVSENGMKNIDNEVINEDSFPIDSVVSDDDQSMLDDMDVFSENKENEESLKIQENDFTKTQEVGDREVVQEEDVFSEESESEEDVFNEDVNLLDVSNMEKEIGDNFEKNTEEDKFSMLDNEISEEEDEVGEKEDEFIEETDSDDSDDSDDELNQLSQELIEEEGKRREVVMD